MMIQTNREQIHISQLADAAAQAVAERLTKSNKSWWRELFPRLPATDWGAKRVELASAITALDVSCEAVYRHAVGGEIGRRPYETLDEATALALAVFRSTVLIAAERGRQRAAHEAEQQAATAAPAVERHGRRGLRRVGGMNQRTKL